MKLNNALFLLVLPASLIAQTAPAKPAATSAAKTGTATPHTVPACVKMPELSPKIPALAAGACAHHLYTITTIPSVKVQNISPMEPSTLLADLGIEPTTFSLDYVDTKVGTGPLAGPHSWYTINYTGYLTDGTKFDSSYDKGEPIVIPYGQHRVIEGWDTGFAGMRVGGKRRLIIPFQLAYGANGKPPIPPKAMLIFDVELVDISETEPRPKTPPAPPTPPQGAPKPGTTQMPPSQGTQPAPAAPPPGSPTKPTPAPSNPANPTTVPPPTDPTKPTSTPPPTTPKP
jgi:peptidylprolyl isomerase